MASATSPLTEVCQPASPCEKLTSQFSTKLLIHSNTRTPRSTRALLPEGHGGLAGQSYPMSRAEVTRCPWAFSPRTIAMPTSDGLDPSLTNRPARKSAAKGVQREQYRGADWLRLRVQEPQKRWIPGQGERVRIHLPPAESRAKSGTRRHHIFTSERASAQISANTY
jgi:hypothetical protein